MLSDSLKNVLRRIGIICIIAAAVLGTPKEDARA
jgi:hypothetical protein